VDTLERHHAACNTEPHGFCAWIEYSRRQPSGALQPKQPERIMQARREQRLDKDLKSGKPEGIEAAVKGTVCTRPGNLPVAGPRVTSQRAVVAVRCRT
jgi:hypothetical protein